MALVIAGGCVACYIYFNQNSLVFNSLKIYTLVEEGYKNVMEYLQFDKNTINYKILDKRITEVVKDNNSYFILGKFNGDIDLKMKDSGNYIKPLLAVSMTLNIDGKKLEIDVTEYINGFLFLNENLDLSKINNEFWLSFLKFKKLLADDIDIANKDIVWNIIDNSGNLSNGEMIISYIKNDLKIEVVEIL